MLRQFVHSVSVITLMAISIVGRADSTTSEQFIKALTERLEITLTEAKNNKQLSNIEYIDELIDQEILPQLNLEVLSKRIYREHWKEIVDKNKKQEAINAVVLSLKRTYRLAVSSYDGQKIEIVESKSLKSYDIVRIKIATDGDKDHMIDFALRQFDSAWKVFDFSVDGIGISKTLYGSISQQIQSDGLEKTLEALAQSGRANTDS
ncbi:MlaC/ttg2D family ABC transporter substrate-binding protein [Alkalimarinus alittae]|uniref:ABC transporter substrate-binding protein n=1 Tax=Alkalimarinus alittae TaxID=2961619 RepID=A0ABY6MXN7_9ALTE|nr:ABC transporter substrate-binding protein [Alkalimarinus alittae]UZE94602.1 ABC transporter substrate-binding protein [Alkalimarinus alittae]